MTDTLTFAERDYLIRQLAMTVHNRRNLIKKLENACDYLPTVDPNEARRNAQIETSRIVIGQIASTVYIIDALLDTLQGPDEIAIKDLVVYLDRAKVERVTE